MSIIGFVRVQLKEELDKVSQEIESEMKMAVSGHKRSGAALGAIHIEEINEFSRFVGGTNGTGKGITGTDHLGLLNNGNGPGRIYPKTRNALAFDGFGKYAGKGHGKDGKYVLPSVNSYEGLHFIESITKKHGGI